MSRAIRTLGAAAVALVALAAVAIAWFEDVPPITAAEAVVVTEHAFSDAGIDAVVSSAATVGSYQSPGRDRVDVWKTTATVDGSTVRLYLQQSDADPVYIDDRTPTGAQQVLSDVQFDALVAQADNPALATQVRRNTMLTVAAAAIVALAVALVAIPAIPVKENPAP